MLVQIEVPVSNKYSVRIEEAKSDNLAIYLTNRLLRSLILCLWVGYRSRSTVSYFLCLHASYLPFTHPPPTPHYSYSCRAARLLQLDLYLPLLMMLQ